MGIGAGNGFAFPGEVLEAPVVKLSLAGPEGESSCGFPQWPTTPGVCSSPVLRTPTVRAKGPKCAAKPVPGMPVLLNRRVQL